MAAAGGPLDCRVRANSFSLSVVNAQRCLFRSCAALRHDALRALVALFRMEFAVARLLPLHNLVKELQGVWRVLLNSARALCCRAFSTSVLFGAIRAIMNDRGNARAVAYRNTWLGVGGSAGLPGWKTRFNSATDRVDSLL